jgi:hypothetical protein
MKRIVLFALVTAACGGSSNSAVDHNRAGTGTASLAVNATATVTSSTTAPLTDLSVTLDDGLGNNVSGATVTIQNAGLGGDVALVEAVAGSGRYTNSKASLPSGDFTLSVVRGADAVHGVVVGNPGAHVLNAPPAVNTTVTANQPLALSWTTPSTAKSATVSTRDFTIKVPDTGTYTIAAADNPPRASQRVIVTRFNEVDIAGALPGSLFQVKVTNSVDPFTVQ